MSAPARLSRPQAAKLDRARQRQASRGQACRKTLLRLGTVKPATLRAYQNHVERFEAWCKKTGRTLRSLADADENLTEYMSHRYLQGEQPADGRYTRFGYILLRTSLDGDRAHQLPLSRKALQGWSALSPGRSRDPLPHVVVHQIAGFLLQRGELDAAMAVEVQFDTYARPSEILALTTADVVGPQPHAGTIYAKDWCVNLANSSTGKTRKNGECDDSVRLGVGDRAWLRSVFAKYYQKKQPRHALFDLPLWRYERLFRMATEQLKLASLKPCPHALRHSGPSHDRWQDFLSLGDVQKRGGWKAIKSCHRYEKHSTILKQVNKLGHAQQQQAAAAARSIHLLFQKALR